MTIGDEAFRDEESILDQIHQEQVFSDFLNDIK